jgi:hypothetical protein
MERGKNSINGSATLFKELKLNNPWSKTKILASNWDVLMKDMMRWWTL